MVAGQSAAGDDALQIHVPAKRAPCLVECMSNAVAACVRADTNLGAIEGVTVSEVMRVEIAVVKAVFLTPLARAQP